MSSYLFNPNDKPGPTFIEIHWNKITTSILKETFNMYNVLKINQHAIPYRAK